jgi:beta-N-acetylhexosaminidase
MTDDDIGQLLWVGFPGPSVPDELRRDLEAGRVGATIVFKRNLAMVNGEIDLDAVAALVGELHRSAPDGTMALVAIDQEGGTVQRVRAPATVWPPMMSLAGVDEAVAEQVGKAMGDELRALAIDIDFAPVLDVHTNPANPIIGERAFGTDPEGVALRTLAFARGLAAAGVLACGKHYPGHGDTTTDSHLELPRIDHDRARLDAIELLPFARAAAAGLPMIMTAHVVFAALDDTVPATLSKPALALLRDTLGYRGVIVSDDLDMKAISDHLGVERAAVEAIRAGCDVLLLCRDADHQAAARAALERESARDDELRHRIAESAARVRAMKTAHALHLARHPAPARDVIGTIEHRRLADRLAGR